MRFRSDQMGRTVVFLRCDGGAGGCPVPDVAPETEGHPLTPPLIGGIFKGGSHAALGRRHER